MASTRMPAGQYKKKLLRFPEDLLEVLEAEAAQQQRSLNGQLVYMLREWYQPKQACTEKNDEHPLNASLVATAS